MLRFLEHRLGLEVAISVNLARGDSCHRGVNWFGIELSAWKGQFRVVEQSIGRIVFPTLPCLKTTIVETGEERPWIDRSNLDPKFLKLQAHRLSDCFNRVFRC